MWACWARHLADSLRHKILLYIIVDIIFSCSVGTFVIFSTKTCLLSFIIWQCYTSTSNFIIGTVVWLLLLKFFKSLGFLLLWLREMDSSMPSFSLSSPTSSQAPTASSLSFLQWNFTLFSLINLLSSHPKVFYEKGVLKCFVKFTEKHLCQILFVNKVAALRLQLY